MKKRIFFHGIGGIGMSALAHYLLEKGYSIDGYDAIESDITDLLKEKGVEIFTSYEGIEINSYSVCIYTAAFSETDELLSAFREKEILSLKRSVALSQLANQGKQIAIAGTHGKTTTTSLVTKVLDYAGLNPTGFIGGISADYESNLVIGDDNIFVVEADEYDRSFMRLNPIIGVVNNIDFDHSDVYKNEKDICDTFQQFVDKIPFYGSLLINYDCKNCQKISHNNINEVMTFGLDNNASLRAKNIIQENFSQKYILEYLNEDLGIIEINLPGKHNIYNSLISIGIGLIHNIPFEIIKSALKEAKGVHRRFEILHRENEVIFIDDYAHHPSEIETTLIALKDEKKIITAIFQPHLFSRTKDFYREFSKTLMIADKVILLPIYPAREEPIEGVDSELIIKSASNPGKIELLKSEQEIFNRLDEEITKTNVFITLGAGNVTSILRNYVNDRFNT